jgi:hypothetical protein
VAGTIGQAFQRLVAAEAEAFVAGAIDRPTTPLFAQFKQRAVLLALDGLDFLRRRRFPKQFPQYPVLQPWHGARAALLPAIPPYFDLLFPCQVEAG